MEDQMRKGAAPIYISDLQLKITELPDKDRQVIRLLLLVDERGRYRELSFQFPKGKELLEDAGLYEKYLLAMINNLLVSFGGALLKLYFDLGDKNLADMAARVLGRFQADNVRNDRTGYGVYLNYINRMNVFLGLEKFRMEVCALEDWPDLSEMEQYFIYLPEDGGKEQDLLRRSAAEMDGRTFCSLDVGGNSIKGAVVQNGKVIVLKEYQWYPTGHKAVSYTHLDVYKRQGPVWSPDPGGAGCVLRCRSGSRYWLLPCDRCRKGLRRAFGSWLWFRRCSPCRGIRGGRL